MSIIRALTSLLDIDSFHNQDCIELLRISVFSAWELQIDNHEVAIWFCRSFHVTNSR